MSYDTLRIYADGLDDLMRMRVGMDNRIGAAKREGNDTAHQTFSVALDSIKIAEKGIYSGLVKAFKLAAPDLYEWTESVCGLGTPTVGRLLGTLGDPLIATPMRMEGEGAARTRVPDGEPYYRTVSQLWQYCGYGDASMKATSGMSQVEAMAMGKRRIKPILHVIQEQALKSAGKKGYCPYRPVYEDKKEFYAETHPEWTPGHIDNAARRIVKKEILRDLWLVRQGLEAQFGGYSPEQIEERKAIATGLVLV